jgi:SAM-dependent methyltransferase
MSSTFDLSAEPHTDAGQLYAVRDSICAADMLIAAVKGLDLFTWLAGRRATAGDIAAHFGFAPRPVDVMTTLFVAMGLLVRRGDVLDLTPLAREHLVAGSPWWMGPYYPPVSDRPIAADLLEILRTGRPALYASRRDEADWHEAMTTERFAEEFTAVMDTRGRITAQALATRLDLPGNARVLDVAGGSGVFACALAARHPSLEAVVFEKPPVDRVAARAIEARGYSGRVSVMAGDMLAGPLPPGFDVHLFSNVLHDWDEDVVRDLLRRSAAALRPGGIIIVHEMFLDDSKSGPLAAAEYSVLLMHVTQGRCYAAAEMIGWLEQAGFLEPRIVEGALGRSAIVATRGPYR